ncbi:MAG: CPBP family intramembrane metalloprotease [Pedobacter sp.]|nr:MAG: CPBP family intramembrane metalloprotease [Pedobacter sp.]
MTERKILFRSISTAITAWLAVWVATQGLFMSEVLAILPWNVNITYVIATIWVLAVTSVALTVLPKYRKISLPKSKLIWLYIIPAIALLFLPLHYALALDIRVYISMIAITVFWQDYLTFGILQPALAKRLSSNQAALTTAIVFISGHVLFSLNNVLDPQLLLVTVAGLVFAFSTKRTGNIYIANIFHIIFYLI